MARAYNQWGWKRSGWPRGRPKSSPERRALVAKVKALLLMNVTVKRISKLSGINTSTIYGWSRGEHFGYVDPDSSILEQFKNWFPREKK